MGEARKVARRFYDSFASGDFEAAGECFADTCVTVTPIGELDKAQHEAFGRSFKSGLPDARMDIVRAVEADDQVFVNGRFRGTHTADLVSPDGTLAATGNAVDLAFSDYFRVQDGRIVAHEIIWDQMAMLAQLGALR